MLSTILTPAGLSVSCHDGLDASVIVSSNKNAHTLVLLNITCSRHWLMLCVLLTTAVVAKHTHNSGAVCDIKVLIAVVC
jgi:hypothetical protein